MAKKKRVSGPTAAKAELFTQFNTTLDSIYRRGVYRTPAQIDASVAALMDRVQASNLSQAQKQHLVELVEQKRMARPPARILPENYKARPGVPVAPQRIVPRDIRNLQAAPEGRKFEPRAQRVQEALTRRLERATEPGLLGQRALQVQQGPVREALQAVGQAKTPRVAARAARTVRGGAPVAERLAQAGRGAKWGRAGLAGGTALLGIPILKSIFGGKEDVGMDPMMQMALAQQLAGGQAGTKRSDLVDIGRLLSIIKSLQGLAAMQGPVNQVGGLI